MGLRRERAGATPSCKTCAHSSPCFSNMGVMGAGNGGSCRRGGLGLESCSGWGPLCLSGPLCEAWRVDNSPRLEAEAPWRTRNSGPGRGFQTGLLGAEAGCESDLGTTFWSYTLLTFICLLGLDLALEGPAAGQSRDREPPPPAVGPLKAHPFGFFSSVFIDTRVGQRPGTPLRWAKR